MKHADQLAERILALDGLPNFQALGRLKVGETVEEVLEAVRDHICRDLFANILANGEEHIDRLETRFGMIKRMGLAN